MTNNGYIQIDINGQKVGIKFGMPAILALFGRWEKKPLKDGVYTETDLAAILFEGYVNNCKRKDVEPELKFEDFYDFVEQTVADEKVAEVLKPVVGCLETSMYIQRLTDKAYEEGKKKVTTKSKPTATESLA